MRPTEENLATYTSFTSKYPSDLLVNLPNTSYVFTMEDIDINNNFRISGHNKNPVKIIRCRATSIRCYSINAKITHCITGLSCSSDTLTSVYCNNSYLRTLGGKFIVDNCHIQHLESCNESVITNCMIDGYGVNSIPVGNRVSYCVCTDEANIFWKINSTTNTVISTKWPYSADSFTLSEEDSAQYLGDDGTQVGAYGGMNPFTDKNPYPLVKKLAVKSNNEDGVLKVKIDVE